MRCSFESNPSKCFGSKLRNSETSAHLHSTGSCTVIQYIWRYNISMGFPACPYPWIFESPVEGLGSSTRAVWMHERSPAASRWHPAAGWKNLNWDYLTRFATNILVKDISLAATERYLPICPCSYLSVYPHLSIYASFHLSFYPSMRASIYLSTAQEIP